MAYKIWDNENESEYFDDGTTFLTKESARQQLITLFWYDLLNEMTPDEANATPLETILEGAHLALLEV